MNRIYLMLCLMGIIFLFLFFVILLYTGKVVPTDVNNLAGIGTIISPFITFIAILIAYFAFVEQRKSNDINKAQYFINQVFTEAKDTRKGLDDIQYNINNDPKSEPLYGHNAAQYFIQLLNDPNNEIKNISNVLHPLNKDGQLFVATLLAQLNNIVQLATSLEHQKDNLNRFEYERANKLIRLLIQSFIIGFSDVFVELINHLRNSSNEIDADNFRQGWRHIGSCWEYGGLMSRLVTLEYVERISPKPAETDYTTLQKRVYDCRRTTFETSVYRYGLSNK